MENLKFDLICYKDTPYINSKILYHLLMSQRIKSLYFLGAFNFIIWAAYILFGKQNMIGFISLIIAVILTGYTFYKIAKLLHNRHFVLSNLRKDMIEKNEPEKVLTYEFTDKAIVCIDGDDRKYYKWADFAGYFIHKDLLIFMDNDSGFLSFEINEIEDEMLEKILDYAGMKLDDKAT